MCGAPNLTLALQFLLVRRRWRRRKVLVIAISYSHIKGPGYKLRHLSSDVDKMLYLTKSEQDI